MRLKTSKQFLKDESGAVMMEYVIIGVLIAAARVLGIVMFSRTILFGFDTAQLGASGDSKKAAESQKNYRQQVQESQKSAADYHDAMHTGNLK